MRGRDASRAADDVAASAATSELPLICHRCGEALVPGRGDFYVVRIEAVADPAPPNLTMPDTAELASQMQRLLDEMRDMSQQELMDHVHRRMTIHLCGPCYRVWIENPAG